MLGEPDENVHSKDDISVEGVVSVFLDEVFIKCWYIHVSFVALVDLDNQLKEFAVNFIKGADWIVDSEMHDGVLLTESQHEDHGQNQVSPQVSDYKCTHGNQEAEALVYSEEVNHLIEGLDEKQGLENDLSHAICLELTVHLDAVQDCEVQELGAVKDVPEVIEVLVSLFFDLHSLEDHEEYLGEHANIVQDVQDEEVGDAQ